MQSRTARPYLFGCLLLTLVSCATAPNASSFGAPNPLDITTDSAVYRFQTSGRAFGEYLVHIAVTIKNASGDTVYLSLPCGAGPHPYREVLTADNLAIAPFELSGCVGASQLEGAANLPRLAVPPRAVMTDQVVLVVRPSRSTDPHVEWPRYGGQFRVGYQRWSIEQGELRQLPIARTVSSPFQLLPPG